VRDTLGGLAGKGLAATVRSTDAFAEIAMVATLYELQSARIGLRRAKREDVKQFAGQMLVDFEKIKTALESFLGSTETPTSPPQSLDTVHQTLIDDLNGAADEDFDGRYIAQQRLAHSEAITLLKTYLNHGEHAGMQNLCGIALPVLEQHARMADELAAQ
jgi:putative membrane protein